VNVPCVETAVEGRRIHAWETTGEVVDDADGRRYPSDSLGDLPSYFGSMREARAYAEDLARDAS
jgi:hypothetical protein